MFLIVQNENYIHLVSLVLYIRLLLHVRLKLSRLAGFLFEQILFSLMSEKIIILRNIDYSKLPSLFLFPNFAQEVGILYQTRHQKKGENQGIYKPFLPSLNLHVRNFRKIRIILIFCL